MLRLKDIVKKYYVADTEVNALKGINLSFRKNEFVSILGPSGCGKTTTLNIIGGLDKYTSGDLFINGVSTKEFNDRDWDVYRNHRVGFIFQAYNLIPHQTILQNVELALTIAGISKEEREERARVVLDQVGLKGQYNKKPNQLSGGQCQRVAIARALVNNPEILLADEPTGALDSETSVQIMDLIKKIAEDRLVIMVTHNPELAEKYSTRIVRLKDGEVIEDTNPFTEEEEIAEINQINDDVEVIDNRKKKERAKMSFWTAFKLSFKNLMSKAKRTFMIVLAGSIGIIGVATVLAVSRGVNDYIDEMQDDMISGNPIYISENSMDYSMLLSGSTLKEKKEALEKGDWVNVRSIISYLVNNKKALLSLSSPNEIDIDYINFIMSMPKEYYSAISLDYGIDITNSIYTSFDCGDDTSRGVSEIDQTKYNREKMSLSAITATYSQTITHLDQETYGRYASIITSLTTPMSQCIPNNDYILSQYDVMYGSMPKNKNDVLLVISDENELQDLVFAQLGYYTEAEFYELIYHNLYENEYPNWKSHFTYEEICSKKFYWYSNDDIYEQSGTTWNYKYQMDDSSNQGYELNICGIVKPKDDVSYGCLESGLLYSEDFARYMISQNIDSNIAKSIITNGDMQSGEIVTNTIITNELVAEFNIPGISTRDDMNGLPTNVFDGYGEIYELDTVNSTKSNKVYIKTTDDTFAAGKDYYFHKTTVLGVSYDLPYYWEKVDETQDNRTTYINGEDTTKIYVGKENQYSQLLSVFGYSGGASIKSITLHDVAGSYIPSGISIYPINFDKKDLVTNYLDQWNDENISELTVNNYYNEETGEFDFDNTLGTYSISYEDRQDIKYSDPVGLIISMIDAMVQIVTVALVAFTALSLVVSTVMVGIITYVSVVERIKEIGVIRSLGGRKKDVSNLFTAETLMIGFSSGVFGIFVTGVLCLLINAGANAGTDGAIKSICHLTIPTAVIMILLSMFLTFIAGIMPAKNAARRDPVQALRSE